MGDKLRGGIVGTVLTVGLALLGYLEFSKQAAVDEAKAQAEASRGVDGRLRNLEDWKIEHRGEFDRVIKDMRALEAALHKHEDSRRAHR